MLEDKVTIKLSTTYNLEIFNLNFYENLSVKSLIYANNCRRILREFGKEILTKLKENIILMA